MYSMQTLNGVTAVKIVVAKSPGDATVPVPKAGNADNCLQSFNTAIINLERLFAAVGPPIQRAIAHFPLPLLPRAVPLLLLSEFLLMRGGPPHQRVSTLLRRGAPPRLRAAPVQTGLRATPVSQDRRSAVAHSP